MARKPEKLTKTVIDSLPFSSVSGEQYTVMDTATPSFGIRVGSQSKTFIVMKRMPHGGAKRVSLGKYGALTLEAARKLAMDTLSQLTHGVDVVGERRAVKAEKEAIAAQKKIAQTRDEETFEWLLQHYKNEHLIKTKGKIVDGVSVGSFGTLQGIAACMKIFGERECQTLKRDDRNKVWENAELVKLDSWLDKPYRSITSEQVLQRFNTLEVSRALRIKGGVLAPMVRTHQLCFTMASSAYEFIKARVYIQSKELIDNPFVVLKVFKKLKKTNVKTRMLNFRSSDELGVWWNALEDYRKVNAVAADYIQFSLLQAGRSIEIVNLTWDMIDLKNEIITYEKTKNGIDYKIPLSPLAMEILKRRKKENTEGCKWVWEYPASKTGHIPKDCKHHFQMLEEAGAKYVSSHDLKRTWATVARHLKYDERELNYLLKHKQDDVNEHYFMKHEDDLREIMNGVEQRYLKAVEESEATEETTA